MPYGHNIATCLHCGRQFTAGDCIPDICPVCEDAGHAGLPLDCPRCWPAPASCQDYKVIGEWECGVRIYPDRGPAPCTDPAERRKRLRVRAALAESRADIAAGVPMASFDRWLAVEFQPCIDANDNLTLGGDDEF